MAITAAEQYLLELINRARLDPAAEAARYGIDLNAGLAPGQLSTASRQVLAPNVLLENAAIKHSQWMIAADIFSHTETNGSTPGSRATAAGYVWSTVGENIAWRGLITTVNFNTMIDLQHRDLFLSAGHRVNILNGAYKEIGIAQEGGLFLYGGKNYNSSMITELFGTSGSKVMLTGVAYTDTDHNNFYTIGEARAGVSFAAQGLSTATAVAGGYTLALTANAAVAVTGTVGTTAFSATVDMSKGNVKLDVVDAKTFLTSGNITLGTGLHNVTLLGVSGLTAVGNGFANIITGNSGGNSINAGAGADVVNGMAGNDTLLGGAGADTVNGGLGNDRIDGGFDSDRMYGNAGADVFVFADNFGRDVVSDFSVAALDKLSLDDQIWGGTVMTAAQVVSNFAHVVAGGVTFEFSANEAITLTGLTSLSGLANAIQIV